MDMSTKKKIALAATASIAGLGLYLKANSEDLFQDFGLAYSKFKFQKQLLAKPQTYTFVEAWYEALQREPNKTAIVFINDNDETSSFTYQQVEDLSNKVANFARELGLNKGDNVALVLENSLEFIPVFLGFSKLGVSVAFININLKAKPLLHCILLSKSKHFFIGPNQIDQVVSLIESEQNTDHSKFIRESRWFSLGLYTPPGFEEFFPNINRQSSKLNDRPPVSADHPCVYIFTSGTTGLPKASIVSHRRVISAGTSFSSLFGINNTDKIYCSLPLYHTSAFALGFSPTVLNTATFVLRKKFSASKFWTDITTHECTIFLYIGELCRYLLLAHSQPPPPHKIRVCIGNGLRPDIWKEFQERFRIPRIGEFYASTEGNAALINITGKPGSVGYIPPLFKRLANLALIKYDVETDQHIRNKKGFCIECAPDEVGELIGMIDPTNPLLQFRGYTDPEATKKKILTNVFTKGDAYFRTGDLLKYSKTGYYYFVDRIGDTFRYKGENVSTSEIEQICMDYPHIKECSVYGVSIPRVDGRAGMILVIPDDKFDIREFYDHVTKTLPSYAVPVFVRLGDSVVVTHTFKHVKHHLVKEGYDPNKIKDRLYFKDDEKKCYSPLDTESYAKLMNLSKL
eukprot:TRINITY_DN8029_c0_g1_i1.p1 TRINITY_DN8029_c0_g1~~TRINITY_DN8029_c0_g1_i1.p1  ORF type:complete len:629 (+),score=104.24 TRINITY_DN8029_c0_g1_i1:60-1946(+)